MNTIDFTKQARFVLNDLPISRAPKIGASIYNGRLVLQHTTLKALRYQCCMSQEEVAAECCRLRIRVSIASLKRAETGKTVLFRTARELAKFYQVPVETLCP